MKRKCLSLLIFCFLISCQNDEDADTLFQKLPSNRTNIYFNNQLKPTEELNMYTFKNFYNGGGVAVGDINNDGLYDLYLTGNQVENKLYLNKGNLEFEDITDKAGVACKNVWSTGASFADVNDDGLIDLYVCKSGPPQVDGVRHNELFINQGDNTFIEKSKEFQLDFTGLSVHAAFFDYDKDSDLDCYLLNNSIRSVGGYDLIKDQREVPNHNGNKLLRNDNGVYKNVSSQKGVYTSDIGFGLGVTIADINQDGWQDIYVSNDYFERDYLYINEQDGSFSEQLEDYFGEISLSSMGADFGDINNDGFPDLYVTDMLPDNLQRYRTKTQFMNWDRYQLQIKQGYYRQFVRNTLQLNNEGQYFQEIGRYANVAASDWSWGALIFDMDNDGFNDIFVANGIAKDLTDQDYINFYANKELVKKQMNQQDETLIMTLLQKIPSKKLVNHAYINQYTHQSKPLQFINKASQIGLAEPNFSNGSAYADLDNDGDLELIVNNVNDAAGIYENRSRNHYIKFNLLNKQMQPSYGTKVSIYYGDMKQYQEVTPFRGFQSCVDPRLNFGLQNNTTIDSAIIEWPNSNFTKLTQLPTDTTVRLQIPSNKAQIVKRKPNLTPIFKLINGEHPQHFDHQSNAFAEDPLLLRTRSMEGPKVDTVDINSDGRSDIYLPGGNQFPGKFLIQGNNFTFEEQFINTFRKHSQSTEVQAHFFDANNDGKKDLYLSHGGDEFQHNNPVYQDRLYIQQTGGSFSESKTDLPSFSTSVAISDDIDQDGDMDLYIAPRLKAGEFGKQISPEIWMNDGSGLFNKDTDWSASVNYDGFVTDADFHDLDFDGQKELIVCGEWGAPTIYWKNRFSFNKKTVSNHLKGFWNRLMINDIDDDGDDDILLGNWGLNSFLKASIDKPLRLFISDIDDNGQVEQLITFQNESKNYPYVLRNELIAAAPVLKKQFLKYDDYKDATIQDILGKGIKPEFIANELRSGWLEQTENGFQFHPFPQEAQLFPVFAFAIDDFSNNGKKELLLGGNYWGCKPQLGIYTAGKGLLLQRHENELIPISSKKTGIELNNQVRDFIKLSTNNQKAMVIINHDAPINLYTYK